MKYKFTLTVCFLLLCVNLCEAQNFLKNFTAAGPFVTLSDTLFFAANDGIHGSELWKSDGTMQGTILVKDICPGAVGSAVSSLTVFNGKIYFSANDGINGAEVWVTDGTAAGTNMLIDINKAPKAGSDPGNFTVVNGQLFFSATDTQDVPSSALWKTDGTATGTVKLTPTDSFGFGQLTAVENMLYFVRENDRVLWQSDGTSAGTKQISVDDFSVIDQLHNVNNHLVFITNYTYNGPNIRLYSLDPAKKKPVLLHEYDAVQYGTVALDNITQVGAGFFYAVQTSTVNDTGADSLYYSNSTVAGTVGVKGFNWQPYLAYSNMQNFISYNNKLYFSSTGNLTLWSSDGTAAGTEQVANSPMPSSTPVISNNNLYYNSQNILHEINSSNIVSVPFSSPQNPTQLFDNNGILYFTAGSSSVGLWNNVASPEISVSSNYGNLAAGATITFQGKADSAILKTITITNNGNQALVLSEISVSGMPFYVNGQPPQLVPPNSSTNFNLEYFPAKQSQVTGSLVIRSNDNMQGNYVIDLSATCSGNSVKSNYGGEALDRSINLTDTTAKVALSNNNIDENKPPSSIIGNFSVKSDTTLFSYQLINNSGANDNAYFSINGTTLVSNSVFNFDTKNTYFILVKVSNGVSSFLQNFVIQINKVNVDTPRGSCAATEQSLSYTLADVAFAGSRIVTVGGGGHILTSDDNGGTWIAANSGVNTDLHHIIFTDSNTGYVLGTNTLLKTEDGGSSWFSLAIPAVVYPGVQTVAFPTSTVGYLFSTSTVAKTVDGGRTWQSFPLNNYDNNLASAYFINENTGFVCGTGETLLTTKDGGMTWQNIALPLGSNTSLVTVYFVSNQTGYVFSSAGDVEQTTDGGATWKRISIVPGGAVNSAFFFNKSVGYAFNNGAEIYRTTDGGVTWAIDPSSEQGAIAKAAFNAAGTVGCAVGSGSPDYGTGRIISLKKPGVAWQTISLLPTDDYYSVNFTDGNNGYVFGTNDNLKTTDGGNTWTVMKLNGQYGFRHSFFLNTDTGYCADLYSLYKTTDGGKTWLKILPGDSSDQIRDIYFINANVGFFSTFYPGRVFKTTDGGVTWTKTTLDFNGPILDIKFINEFGGLAVGAGGVLYRTTDQGTTWQQISSTTNVWLTTIKIFDANNAIIGGWGGLILRTTNGGISWSQEPNAIQGDVAYFNFTDNNHGYAFAGYEGSATQVYETNDGGKTWQLNTGISGASGVCSQGESLYLVGGEGLVAKFGAPQGPATPGYINGETEVAQHVKTDYSVPLTTGLNYRWAVTGNAKITYTANQATVQWESAGSYLLQVTAYDNCGTSNVRNINVIVDSIPQLQIAGPSLVLAGALNTTYNTLANNNESYNWFTVGDSSHSVSNNMVNINWGKPGIGKVSVLATDTNSGNRESALLDVNILGNVPTFVYGTADFNPKPQYSGIIYVSSNPSVATIVNGKVHLAGVGVTIISGKFEGITESQAISVIPATLTVTANSNTGIKGYPLPRFTITYSGFVNGDTTSSLATQPTAITTATSSSSPGNYTITASGGVSNNYSFTYVPGTLKLAPSSYYSYTIPTKTYGDTDFLEFGQYGPGLTYTSSNPAVATVVNGEIHITGAGTSTITVSNGSNSLNKILTVNQAALTITANNQTKVTGAANPALTATYSGFVNGETQANLTTLPVVSTTAINSSPAGSYPITVSGAGSPNYAITYVAGTLTVTTAGEQSIIATDALMNEPVVNAAVSPNSDGINDVLTISNIDRYPDNKITLINQSGAKVFEVSSYDNVNKVFNGRSNINNKQQPAGTYFYELQYRDNGVMKSKTGYIVLKYE